jgi:translation initiation factor RLI1
MYKYVSDIVLQWNQMEKSYEDFTLAIEQGDIHKGEVVGILGPNGIGKTTFIKLLAGLEKPDMGFSPLLGSSSISYKPQYISANYNDSVESVLRSIVKDDFDSTQYKSAIVQPLNLDRLLDRYVNELSGGELQRVAIATCLSRDSSIFLLDEPSAYLDVEGLGTLFESESRLANALAQRVQHLGLELLLVTDKIVVNEKHASPPPRAVQGIKLGHHLLLGLGAGYPPVQDNNIAEFTIERTAPGILDTH